MSRYKSYGYNGRRRGSKVFWIFIAIILFGAIYYPFYGKNLQYQIGILVLRVFSTVGLLLIIIGFLLMGIGVLMVSAQKSLKNFLIGLLIMVSGFYLLYLI